MKIRSSIKTDLLRIVMLRGTILAAIGCLSLIFSGIFLPLNTLQFFGAPIVLSSILLITVSFYPYQKLKKLEITPHEITILDDQQFLFSWKKKPTFIVPFREIEKLINIDLAGQYGIGLFLKESAIKEITVVDPDFDILKFKASCEKNYKCNLFLPYFSKKSFELLLKFHCI